MEKTRSIPLKEGDRLINTDRNGEYGEPYDNFRAIAAMLTVVLRPILKEGTKVQCHHVSMIMMVVKLSRMITSPFKLDTWVDIAGYVGAGWEATEREQADDARKKSSGD